MKKRRAFLFVLCATLAMTACAGGRSLSQEAIQTCKASLSREFEIPIQESLSEDGMEYKEHAGFKFGSIDETHAFVRYSDDDPIGVDDIPFTDPEGLNIRLRSGDLAIDQSDLYVRTGKHHATYCLLTPFGGLGLSGKFQGFAALIALDVQGEVASKPMGEVIRRR
jgi:hypothetical protein